MFLGFIPEQQEHKSEFNCVIDVFVSIYGAQNPTITKKYMIDKCFEYGRHFYPELNPLDRGIDEEEQAFEERKPEIIHKHGVNSEILLKICQELDISIYGFDILGHNFIKHRAKSHNNKCFVYYCVNNHCYCIIDKHEVKSLIERAKSVDTKFNSFFIEEEVIEETTDRFLGEIVEEKNTSIYK